MTGSAGRRAVDAEPAQIAVGADGVVFHTGADWALAPCGRVLRGEVRLGPHALPPQAIPTVPFAALVLEDRCGLTLAIVRHAYLDRGAAHACVVVEGAVLDRLGRHLVGGRDRVVCLSRMADGEAGDPRWRVPNRPGPLASATSGARAPTRHPTNGA